MLNQKYPIYNIEKFNDKLLIISYCVFKIKKIIFKILKIKCNNSIQPNLTNFNV